MLPEIKEAFIKVKEDIDYLKKELQKIKIELLGIKINQESFSKTLNYLKTQQTDKPTHIPTHKSNTPTHIPTHNRNIPTLQHINPTQNKTPTDNLPLYSPKRQNIGFSIGNEGVPTNQQTNQQTNQHIFQHINFTQKKHENHEKHDINSISKATEILNNLDELKKELRLKIKRLTPQEIAVFSLLYDLENQGNEVDYPLLSSKLSLSESSIRDYIGKLQKKGIPIIKEKLNNKKIILHISQDFKKIASLDTILKLREL